VPAKEKSEKFPISVKAGSSSVKIYRDRKRSGDCFLLVFYLGRKRRRLNFSSLDAARKELRRRRPNWLVATWTRFSLPAGTGSFTEYAQPAKTLAGHSLLDAANFYMRHHANGVAGRMVSEATEYFRQVKSGAGRSSVYLKEIRYRLGSFARAFNIEVRELVPQDVADYLEGLKLHPRNFNNQLAMLRTFFAFCEARGWLSKHADLLSRIERRSTTGSGIEIFTPAEVRVFTR
jgi:hypothetical protein